MCCFYFFPNSARRNRGCGLSMDAAYTRTFTVYTFHLIIFGFVLYFVFFLCFLIALNLLIHFNKKEKCLPSSLRYQQQATTISRQNLFTKSRKSTKYLGKKGNKHSKKPTTDNLQAARQANYFDRHRETNQQTPSASSQPTRKENFKQLQCKSQES